MGGARVTALASSTYAPFTWRLLTFTGWNWKCLVIIVIKTDLSGFVVPMHSGLCEQYVKSGYALGIWLPVSHAPSCIGTTNPSRTGLNPLNRLLATPWLVGAAHTRNGIFEHGEFENQLMHNTLLTRIKFCEASPTAQRFICICFWHK